MLATGTAVSVRDFVDATCVEIDPRYYRPTEVDVLVGDARKAREKLGWVHEIGWQALCEEMVAADLLTLATEHRRNMD